jgi:cytidylate kinase
VAKHLNVLQDYSPEHRHAYEALNHLAERVFERDPEDSARQDSPIQKSKAHSTGGKG